MSKPSKILVVGSTQSTTHKAALHALLASLPATEVVVVDTLDEAAARGTAGDILMVDDIKYSKRVLPSMPICPCDPPTLKYVKPYVDTSFRGGSRGKGGKVKWERK